VLSARSPAGPEADQDVQRFRGRRSAKAYLRPLIVGYILLALRTLRGVCGHMQIGSEGAPVGGPGLMRGLVGCVRRDKPAWRRR
jgi:hypothetical protein